MQRTINGVLPLNFGFNGAYKQASIIGGPYDSFPENGMFGVCVRREPTTKDFDIKLDIPDMSTPDDPKDVEKLICETIDALYRGKAVYMGCMAGFGRTGLIMAIIAKALGYPDPIKHVRDTYYPRAVETVPQEKYVREFDVTGIKKHIRRTAWGQLLGRFQ